MAEYALLDSGSGKKLERFGPWRIIRPCQQAVWRPNDLSLWEGAEALFWRDPEGRWLKQADFPSSWTVSMGGLRFRLEATDFGHLGLFPEQAPFWSWIASEAAKRKGASLLNLFAYSGGSTLAGASAGASVCHLDASKKMVDWARENASLNGMEKAPIRWIVDDVKKFLRRELKRGSSYDGVILDPPTFGRGKRGELFKIERDLPEILEAVRRLLSEKPLFVLLTCHTPGYTPLTLHHLLKQSLSGLGGGIECGEMLLEGSGGAFSLPSGSFARWTC